MHKNLALIFPSKTIALDNDNSPLQNLPTVVGLKLCKMPYFLKIRCPWPSCSTLSLGAPYFYKTLKQAPYTIPHNHKTVALEKLPSNINTINTIKTIKLPHFLFNFTQLHSTSPLPSNKLKLQIRAKIIHSTCVSRWNSRS